ITRTLPWPGSSKIGPLAPARSVPCKAREPWQEFSRRLYAQASNGEPASWCRERDSNLHSVASSRFWLRLRFALNVRRAPHVSLHQIRFEPTNLHRGAGRGNRTLTLLPELDFESSASTNSATPALRARGVTKDRTLPA